MIETRQAGAAPVFEQALENVMPTSRSFAPRCGATYQVPVEVRSSAVSAGIR